MSTSLCVEKNLPRGHAPQEKQSAHRYRRRARALNPGFLSRLRKDVVDDVARPSARDGRVPRIAWYAHCVRLSAVLAFRASTTGRHAAAPGLRERFDPSASSTSESCATPRLSLSAEATP